MNKKSKYLIAGISAVVLVFCSAFYIGYAVASTPGSSADPIVTKSYVDSLIQSKIDELNIDNKIQDAINDSSSNYVGVSDLNDKLTDYMSTYDFGYKTITLEAGKKLEGNIGCEFIIRSGSAKCDVENATMGIYDYTNGGFISKDMRFSANHYYVFHYTGRKIIAETECEILIRGNYTVS